MNPDLVPLLAGGALVLLAVVGLASLSSRRARLRSPSAARALAAMQEVFEPEVEHRVDEERREEDGRVARPRDGGSGTR